MAKTVVGLYDRLDTAQQVVRELQNHGFARDDISLAARNPEEGQMSGAARDTQASEAGHGAATGAGTGAVLGGLAGLVVGLAALAIPGVGPIIAAGPLATTLAGAGVGAVAGGLIGALTNAGVPEEEAQAYAEGVRRGSTLVMVKSPDEQADQAAEIMNRFNPIDVNTRAGQWQQQENRSQFDENAQPYSGQDMATQRSTSTDADTEKHIPIVEEEMRVGKRDVERGGVRVRSYVTEKPVEETHHLRDESVNVERRPADRPLQDADMNAAFQEQTFEVSETDEELVVDKSPHVVEDVVVSKSVEERPETVRDTVRRTNVETENLGPNRTRSARDWSSFDSDFHNHYDMAHGTQGRDYNYYEPGYRYGYDLAGMDRYRGRKWTEIEPDARRDWERTHAGSKWDDFKDTIRYAWERVTGSGTDTASGIGADYSRPGTEAYGTGSQKGLYPDSENP